MGGRGGGGECGGLRFGKAFCREQTSLQGMNNSVERSQVFPPFESER